MIKLRLPSKTQPPTIRLPKLQDQECRHIMAAVAPNVLKKHPAYKQKSRWQGRFIVAAWVRFPEGLNKPVGLMLEVTDQNGKQNYKVDLCPPNRQSLILLNGTVTIVVEGAVREMILVLQGLPENAVWILDEYRIEPVGAAESKIAVQPAIETV